MNDSPAFGCPAQCTVLPHRPAHNDLHDFTCGFFIFYLFATNTILVNQGSSARLTVSRLLGGSPIGHSTTRLFNILQWFGQIRETSKMCTVGVLPGTVLTLF